MNANRVEGEGYGRKDAICKRAGPFQKEKKKVPPTPDRQIEIGRWVVRCEPGNRRRPPSGGRNKTIATERRSFPYPETEIRCSRVKPFSQPERPRACSRLTMSDRQPWKRRRAIWQNRQNIKRGTVGGLSGDQVIGNSSNGDRSGRVPHIPAGQSEEEKPKKRKGLFRTEIVSPAKSRQRRQK